MKLDSRSRRHRSAGAASIGVYPNGGNWCCMESGPRWEIDVFGRPCAIIAAGQSLVRSPCHLGVLGVATFTRSNKRRPRASPPHRVGEGEGQDVER